MSTEERQPENGAAEGQNAGRGGIAILFAKVFFILTGLVQQALLSRVIGQDGYGALSRVLAAANIPNNVVVSGSIQAMSRTVSQSGKDDQAAFRAAMRVHVPLALFLGGAFAMAAPFYASFQGTREITLPLVVMAVVLTIYSVYAPMVGAINGRRKFLRQATLDITAATLRTVGLAGAGYVFLRRGLDGTLGATSGAAVAIGCVLPLALMFSQALRRPRAGSTYAFDARAYLIALLPLALIQLGTNVLMQVDIMLLGSFLSKASQTTGLANPGKAANEWVGVYRSCQLFAFLPYQLLVSITQVLFPMVAKAHADKDAAGVRAYVERGARIGVIAGGLMVGVIVAIPGPIIGILYPAEMAERGATTLRILACGQGLFALMGIAMTVLASLGRERLGAFISAGAIVVSMIALYTFARPQPFGEGQLIGTAIGTSIALAVAFVAAAYAVRRLAGSFIPWLTAARVAFAVGLLVAVGDRIPHGGKLLTIVTAAGLGALYLVALVVTRELTREDAKLLRTLRK